MTRLLLLLAAALSALSVLSPTSAAAPSPRSLVLRASDLPAGFTGGQPVAVSNAQAALRDHVPLSTYKRHGRIVSYDVSFSHTGGNIIGVLNSVVQYRTAGGAHWDFQRWATSMRQSADQHPTSSRMLPVPSSLGNEAIGLTVREPKEGVVLHYWIVMFRRGMYWSTLTVIGDTPRSLAGTAVQWAQRIDARARKAA